MIKAVIFDMDGLLIDSELIWIEADLNVFKKVGVPLTSEMTKETIGLREDEVVEHWFQRYPWTGVSKQKVYEDIIEEVVRLFNEKLKAMGGMNEIIEFFISQNIPISIASSSEDRVINAALNKFSIRDKMKIIYSAEHELFGKPHPGVYITTAQKLGVAPSECLVFEDSPNGVLSAKAAKMKCVVVPNAHVVDTRVFGIADLKLSSLKDFTLEHLESLNK
jgi:sugar-phosphatase